MIEDPSPSSLPSRSSDPSPSPLAPSSGASPSVAAIPSPIDVRPVCTTCTIQVNQTTTSASAGSSVGITGSNGEQLGTIGLTGSSTVTVNVQASTQQAPINAVSAAVEITIFDEYGNPVTSLSSPIQICLTTSVTDVLFFFPSYLFLFSIFLFIFIFIFLFEFNIKNQNSKRMTRV